VLLDPTYTAKAMAGLIARHRELAPAVFFHAGGWPGRFAYEEEL
jgi:1-aminocyclopropane-1-carboxylate deaminase/D-cysteine desulfhydrase-like pyridoxal-dependent ACC family enzyme